MKILLFLVTLSLTRASLLQGRSGDSTYSAESRSSDGSSSSSIPAVLAVKKGSSFSATDNILLRPEDLASILDSGNFVTVQSSGSAGDLPITYAAIPVIRNGNSYSVATDSLASLRQGAQGVSLEKHNDGGYGFRQAVVAATRSESAGSSGLSYNDVTRVATSQTNAAALSSASRTTNSYSVDTVRSVNPEPIVVVQSSNVATSSVNQRGDATYTTKNSGSTQRSDSISSYAAEGSRTASVAPISFIGSSDSVSVTAQSSAPTVSAVRTGNAYSAVEINRSAPVVQSALSSTTRTGTSYSGGVSNAPVVNVNRNAESVSQTSNADRSSSYSGVVRTSIASAPGMSNPVIIGATNREASQTSLYRNSIPGEPFVDYPIYKDIPPTRFSCADHPYDHGYYADVDAGCQVYHNCNLGKKTSFLCPNGTLFNQEVLVCDWWFNVNCDAAPEFYSKNRDIGIAASPIVRVGASSTKTSTIDANTRTTAYGESQDSSAASNRAVQTSPAANTY